MFTDQVAWKCFGCSIRTLHNAGREREDDKCKARQDVPGKGEGGRLRAPTPGQLVRRRHAALVATRLADFHGEKLGRVLSSSEMRTGAGKVSDVSHPETLRPLALDSDCPDRAGKVVGGVKCDRVAPAGPVPRARTLPGPADGVWAPAPHGGVAVTVRVHVRPRSGALSRKHPAQGARGDTGHVSPPSPSPTSGHSASPLPQRQGRESGGPGGPAPRRPAPPASAPHMHSRFQPLQPGRGRASCGKRRSA